MMNPGSLIRLRAYGGEEIVRRIVKINPGVVLVCKEEEYQSAQEEGREPISVGFRFEYILE
ncbi:MAG: hypothetical protein HY664_01080 [Chloroflexi bacterium]|nr:hypothetical protein [Chloroflexota bacterium]